MAVNDEDPAVTAKRWAAEHCPCLSTEGFDALVELITQERNKSFLDGMDEIRYGNGY